MHDTSCIGIDNGCRLAVGWFHYEVQESTI